MSKSWFVRSLVIHPASTTHLQLSGEELATGLALERLPVGPEGTEDLDASLDAGFGVPKAA